MKKQLKHQHQMHDLGFVAVRVFVPEQAADALRAHASMERIDYLHQVVEDAPDGDPRLAIIAKLNLVTPLTQGQKAELRATTTNAAHLDRVLDDLDAIESAMWDATRAARLAQDEATVIRAQARAAVAAMDYRRLRATLTGRTGGNGA